MDEKSPINNELGEHNVNRTRKRYLADAMLMLSLH